MLASLVLAALTVGPPGDAFYTPPTRLPEQRDGAVVWMREYTGGSALPSAAVNYLVLYETVAADGKFVAVSGTLSIPHGTPPAGGWPIVSWAHGTTGNAPQCAPSRFHSLDLEQRLMDAFVRHGYAVAASDYEGNGTPGIHPYFVADSTAKDITDIVRAAREIDPQIGKRWIVMGHSEGGAAALSTGLIGPVWAPDLDLLGAAAFAPATYIENMVQAALIEDTPNGSFAYLALLVDGFSTVDPNIVLSQMLTPQAQQLMPELATRCIDDLSDHSGWTQIPPRAIFRTSANVDALYQDVAQNDPAYFTLHVPVLLLQGGDDEAIAPASTVHVQVEYCRRGTPTTLKIYPDATHGTVLVQGIDDALEWADQRFAGVPAQGC